MQKNTATQKWWNYYRTRTLASVAVASDANNTVVQYVLAERCFIKGKCRLRMQLLFLLKITHTSAQA